MILNFYLLYVAIVYIYIYYTFFFLIYMLSKIGQI